jgi:hypothetical protein
MELAILLATNRFVEFVRSSRHHHERTGGEGAEDLGDQVERGDEDKGFADSVGDALSLAFVRAVEWLDNDARWAEADGVAVDVEGG